MGNKPRNRSAAKKKARSRPAPTQQAGQRKPWLQWLLIGGGAVAIVVLLALAVGNLEGKPEPPQGIERFSGLLREHTEQAVSYPQDPPVGGAHASIWANCGFYDTPIPSENAVHSLEHGVVWITFQPDLPTADIDKLRDFADQPKVLVSPYPGLTDPVVASTWGNQIRLDGADDSRLEDFVLTMKDGPDTPEPGASCSGGVGNPS